MVEQEVFTPTQLAELTTTKEEAKANKNQSTDFLKTLQEANKFVNTVKAIVITGKSLVDQAQGEKPKVGNHEGAKFEKGVEAGIKKANAGASKPRTPNSEPKAPIKEKEITIDASIVREYFKEKLNLLDDNMTGKEAKEMLKPLLEASTFDPQISEEIKKAVTLK